MGFWGMPIELDVRPTNPQDTDISTVDTLRQMIALANISAIDPYVCSTLDFCLRQTAKSNPAKRDIARAIWWWVKNHVKFEQDESILARELGYQNDPNQELLIPPSLLLRMPQPTGDCDDFSVLIASLLKCAHILCWFVAIAVDETEPYRFSHVYVRAYFEDEGGYMAMDVSHGGVPDWETQKQVFRKLEWRV